MRIAVIAGLLVCCFLSVVPVARAAGLYCALNDPTVQRAYVSEVRRIGREPRLQLRNLASRFRRTVNVEYSTFFVSNSGVCHRFRSPAAAAFNLGLLKEKLRNDNVSVIVVGSY
jgi:hypothetical protein